MKTLIIAEKPSVATDLSKALGKFKKVDDYYENDELIIGSALGHLVELYMPHDMDEKLKSWNLKYLPIIPKKFDLKPIERSKKKLTGLKKLIARKDVGALINACDAGREGELIFAYIYQVTKCKKPVQRMWMSSMTKQAIQDAFKHLRSHESMQSLEQAARCRSESDWLIGINGTRVITSKMFGFRGGQAASVGRVQTPTLYMTVERERAIQNFIPQDYWKITAEFGIHAGNYEGVFQKPKFKKESEHDRVDRIWQKEEAERIFNEVKAASEAIITEEKKRSRQSAPRLYDLTTLQREANNRFGYSAGRTLQIAQALYETHKVITYPRTDARALPEDYENTCKDTLRSLDSEYSTFSKFILDNNRINKDDKRVFNNKQISDHFAIIPTEVSGKKLSDDQQKVYDMIVRRFLSVFYPPAEFDVTTRITTAATHEFKTEGKILVVPGWLAVYGKTADSSDHLVPVSTEDGKPPKGSVVDTQLHEEQTKPPPRYTEATLLGAMESAGKLVDDDELAEAMKDKGLGTPATRAQIIENLIREKYLERHQRELVPTTKANQLIDYLQAINAEGLISPAMTGEWEHKLHQIEDGQLSRDEFMKGIIDVTKDIVSKTIDFDEMKEGVEETKVMAPTDGKPMVKTIKAYRSQDGEITINNVIGNRDITEDEVAELFKEGKIGPLDGFRSKAGKPFRASLVFEENKAKLAFEPRAEDGEDGEEVDLTQFSTIGDCPACKSGKVYETTNAYACEKQLKRTGDCTFRVSRFLLSRPIPPEQFLKLLREKKTDLLDKFKSKRTGRFFSAYVVLKNDGKIGFEFEQKTPKATKKTAKKTVKKKAATKATKE